MANAAEAPATAEGLTSHTRFHLLDQDQLGTLAAGIDPDRVRRNDDGISHVEAWDVRRRLIQIFGVGGWSKQILSKELVFKESYGSGSGRGIRVVYDVTLRLIVRNRAGQVVGAFDDAATGEASSHDDSRRVKTPGEVLDQAVKTAISQALKRCAVDLGDQFGLSLYNAGSVLPVVVPDPAGHALEAVQAWDDRDGLRRALARAKGAGVLHESTSDPRDPDELVVLGPWITERGLALADAGRVAAAQDRAAEASQDPSPQQSPVPEVGEGGWPAPDDPDQEWADYADMPFTVVPESSAGDYGDGYGDPWAEGVERLARMALKGWDDADAVKNIRNLAEERQLLEVEVTDRQWAEHRLGELLDARITELITDHAKAGRPAAAQGGTRS